MARQEETCWSCGAAYAPARAAAGGPRMTALTAAARFDDDGGHPARLTPRPLVGV
jgi:hypothetical protein